MCLKNKIINWENQTEGISINKEDMIQNENESHQPKLSQVIALINPSTLSINLTTSTYSMTLDPMFPARKTCSADSANTILGDDYLFLAKSVIKCFLYEDLSMMKYYMYTLYQLEIIILSLMLKLTS